MEHPNIAASHDMNQLTRLDVSDLNETWLKGQDVWIAQRKCLWLAFPSDLPIRSDTPSVAVDEETEVGIVEQEFSV